MFDDTTFKTLTRMVKAIIMALFLVDFLMTMKVKEYYGRSFWAKLGQHYNTYNIISPNCGAFTFGFHI